MVVGVAFEDLIVGQLALSEKSIDRDHLAFDADGIKERDDSFDLVGAFGLLIALLVRNAYFFWVWQVFVSWPTALMIWV
jgi:hypothetical protein